ncbi:unnamed protein product [Anisakis simplex]|uniref:Uncharacterized protein n=1 Tax=Anisakis simplex TaxID=6269 RepID=A0A0M3J4E0_ANISI|nr:unnamed protein product [Anisakis simplex]
MTIGDNQGLYGRNGGNNQDLYDRAADNNQGLYDSTTAQAPFGQPSSTYGINHHQNQGRLDLYNQHNGGNYRNDPMLSPTTGSYDPANPYFQAIDQKTRSLSREWTVSSGTVFFPSLLHTLLSLLTFWILN